MDVAEPADGSPLRQEKRYRVEYLRAALVADMEVVEGHAQWRHSEMEDKIDAQSGKDPGRLRVLAGGGPALSARVAG